MPCHCVGSLAGFQAVLNLPTRLWARADGNPKGAPLSDQQLTNNNQRIERGAEADDRRFTTEEVSDLLNISYPERLDPSHRQQLVDAVKILFLYGMRMFEVLTLWVEEALAGC